MLALAKNRRKEIVVKFLIEKTYSNVQRERLYSRNERVYESYFERFLLLWLFFVCRSLAVYCVVSNTPCRSYNPLAEIVELLEPMRQSHTHTHTQTETHSFRCRIEFSFVARYIIGEKNGYLIEWMATTQNGIRRTNDGIGSLFIDVFRKENVHHFFVWPRQRRWMRYRKSTTLLPHQSPLI